jgi:putative component of toxin-antitoxin plasmid stabilization module
MLPIQVIVQNKTYFVKWVYTFRDTRKKKTLSERARIVVLLPMGKVRLVRKEAREQVTSCTYKELSVIQIGHLHSVED